MGDSLVEYDVDPANPDATCTHRSGHAPPVVPGADAHTFNADLAMPGCDAPTTAHASGPRVLAEAVSQTGYW